MDKVIYQTQVTEYKATDVEGVGRLRTVADKIYKWVKNEAGEACVAGRVYFYGTATVACTSIYKMNQTDKGTNLALMAGVAMSAIPDGQYGWIQVYGANQSVAGYASGGTAIAVGMDLIGVNDQTYVVAGSASGTAPAYARGITAMEALASSVTVATALDSFIRCL
jgi:hypothetical protein